MKRRLLSALLAMAMLLTMVPAAFAADGDTPGESMESTENISAQGNESEEMTGEPSEPTDPEENPPVSENAVYVSEQGNNGTEESPNLGTDKDNPVKTLAHAVSVAEDGATIYVMSDLTMTESARFYGKDITITSGDGGPYTVTRGEDFAQIQDAARSTYNPAMIEVDSTDGPDTASLTLTNIIFDDAGKQGGKAGEDDSIYFIQADSEGDGNTVFGSMKIPHGDIVQDAIIATYNNVGTITLGDGAVLKNFGGMSAVRLASGSLNYFQDLCLLLCLLFRNIR